MKTQLILSMYDCLLSGKKVERQAFCANNRISERTFYRYIKEIGIFLMHNKSDSVLQVDEPDGIYYLESIR